MPSGLPRRSNAELLCAAFERLHPFQRVQDYRYVGFGSIYFSDFQLIHRELGITNMLSIRKGYFGKGLLSLHRPYRCIRLKFATSAEVLPTINWRRRSIVWLDYDDRLNTEILGDIATVLSTRWKPEPCLSLVPTPRPMLSRPAKTAMLIKSKPENPSNSAIIVCGSQRNCWREVARRHFWSRAARPGTR